VHASGEDGGFQKLKNISESQRVVYLYPATEHLDLALNDDSITVFRGRHNRRKQKTYAAAAAVVLGAIAVTASLDHDPGITPPPQPVHQARAMQTPMLAVDEPPAGTSAEAEVEAEVASPKEAAVEVEVEAEVASPKEAAPLEKERVEARPQTLPAPQVVTEHRRPPRPPPAARGTLSVSGDAFTVKVRDAMGTFHTGGALPAGAYAIWAAWTEDETLSSTGRSVDIPANASVTVRCSSGFRLCSVEQ
jgi:hypothetical protein